MRRFIPWFLLASLAVASPALAQAPDADASDDGPPPGETVHLREGWYRVEPPGTPQEGFVGTLETGPQPRRPTPREAAPAKPRERLAPGARLEELPEERPPPRRARALDCEREQARYMEELFRIAGIWHFPEALVLVQTLDATPGLMTQTPWLRFDLFGLASAGSWVGSPVGVDPIRPLGWDEGLRWAARDLVACWSPGG